MKELLGHKKQIEVLMRMQKTKLPQSLLFIGPEKIGKKTIAIEFASLILKSTTEELIKGIHPDFIFIKPEGKEIKIGQLREELILKLCLKPFRGQYRVAIIDQAETMNIESQNALLKTLEEPPTNTILILISSLKEALLPTIRSRVQQIKFFPLKNEELRAFLGKNKLKEEQKENILKISMGKPGIMIELLEKKKYHEMILALKEFEEKIKSDLVEQFEYAKKIADNENTKETLELWFVWMRNTLMNKIFKEKSEFSEIWQLKASLQRLERVYLLISNNNISSRLALENFFLGN